MGRRGRPSPRRVPLETVAEVLRLYEERYHDFNVRHFHEKLVEEHGLGLSYTWVKLALQGAGLVKKARKRRPPGVRPMPAMLPGQCPSENKRLQKHGKAEHLYYNRQLLRQRWPFHLKLHSKAFSDLCWSDHWVARCTVMRITQMLLVSDESLGTGSQPLAIRS